MGRVGIIHRGGHFEAVGGRKHLDPRNGPGAGDVLRRLMACAQVAVHKARTITQKHNRKVVMGDVELDLLNRANGNERS